MTIFKQGHELSSDKVKKKEFKVGYEDLLNGYGNSIYPDVYSFEELMMIIDDINPDLGTLLITEDNNSHTNTIILFLVNIMSKKYKPFIYRPSFKRDYVQTRFLVI